MGKKAWHISNKKALAKVDVNAPLLPVCETLSVRQSLEKFAGGDLDYHLSAPLMCSLAQTPIERPVRGRLCTHIQAFDHSTYVRSM
jgi:hypothetical protein